LARWSSGVDDERLDDPQQVLGEFVEIGIGEANAGPVDVETTNHRVSEVLRNVRCHRLGVRVRPPRHQEQPEMLVLRQPLKGGRHGLRDRVGRVGDPSQMCRQPVLKSTGGMHGGRDEQGVGAGEIPVDGLPCDSQRAGDVSDGEVCALRIDGLARGIEDPGDRFLVCRGGRTGPAMGAHDGIVRQPR